MPGTDHRDAYELLGVERHSSVAEIRDAYRRLAHEVHPDRRGPGGAVRMAEINDAYRILRDPGRRAVYDASRHDGAATPSASPWATPAAPPSTDGLFGRGPDVAPAPVHSGGPRLPWRGMAIFAAVGSVAVLGASQVIGPPADRGPDNVLSPGACVVIERNDDAREVACSGTSDLVVTELVGFDDTCPYGTDAHRDRQGMGWACVAAAP